LSVERARQTASQQAAPPRPSTSHIPEGTRRYVDFIRGDKTENLASSRRNKGHVLHDEDTATRLARNAGWLRRVEHGGHLYDEILVPLDKVMLDRGPGPQEKLVARPPIGYKGSDWPNHLGAYGYLRGYDDGSGWTRINRAALKATDPAVSDADFYPYNPFVRYRRLHAGPK